MIGTCIVLGRIFNTKRCNYNVSCFRLIFKCNSIFSAGPKSYYCIDFDSEKYKRSSKGVQHRIKLNYEEYKDVVYKSRRLEVENVGIRLRKNQMSTILQNKTGMRNVFIKSYVENDAISCSSEFLSDRSINFWNKVHCFK